MAYTERRAKAERWEGKDRLVSAGNGLYLNVRRSSKTWIIRRRINGRMQVRTIGRYPAMRFVEARAIAAEQALERFPSERTVQSLAEEYYQDVVAVEHRRPALFRGYLDRAILPELGTRRVAELTASDVAAVIRGYRDRGPRTADVLRSSLSALFKYAVDIGAREDNPAALLTRRVSGYRPRSRSRVLTDDEIRSVWGIEYPHGRLMRFLLLTGLRLSEALKGADAGDIWQVSAEISQNRRAHWVFLTASAKAQLPLHHTSVQAADIWVKRWCAREGIDPPFVLHDCRRTAATRLAGAGCEPFIVERVLNHSMQGVMAIYNRSEYREERIEAAKRLESELLRVVRP